MFIHTIKSRVKGISRHHSSCNISNPEGLKEVGGNRWQKTENSGEETLVAEHSRICQYKLERSNVDIFSHVNDVMRVNTSLLASTTLMSAIDQMYEKAINIKD